MYKPKAIRSEKGRRGSVRENPTHGVHLDGMLGPASRPARRGRSAGQCGRYPPKLLKLLS